MTNTTEAPDLTYGFVLSTHCDDKTLSRELAAGRLVHHSTLGDIEVYRDPDNFTAMHVDDYFPTVMALGRGTAPAPGDDPAFIICNTTAMRIRDCGVLLPQTVHIMAHPDRLAEINTDTAGVTVTIGSFNDDDWTWEYGMPVMTAVGALGQLAANPGIEPTWLISALEDAYDNDLADFDTLVATVNDRARAWGYRDGYGLVDHICPDLMSYALSAA